MQAVAVDEGNCAEETWDTPVNGTLRWKTLLSGDRHGTREIVCGLAMIAPGEHFAQHHHPQAEVYFGIEGEAQVLIDGLPHRLAPGIALYIPGGALHGIPAVSMPVKWFYTFACDSFDQIAYTFPFPAAEAV